MSQILAIKQSVVVIAKILQTEKTEWHHIHAAWLESKAQNNAMGTSSKSLFESQNEKGKE